MSGTRGSRRRRLAAWRRVTRRLPILRSLALSLLLTSALVAGTVARPAPIAPLKLAPMLVASPLRLNGVTVHAPKPKVVKLPAPKKPDWRLGMGVAPAGHAIPVSLTAYCLKGTTRRGRYVRPGIVAADPKLFPLARYLEIYVGKKYLGRFLIDDTGGAIKGNIIDIWTPTCREAVLFGRRRGTAILVPRGERAESTPDVANLMSIVRKR